MSTPTDDLEAKARGPIVHELKCWPGPFQAVNSGAKPFEWRKDDRDYRVGDTLRLREYDPSKPMGQYNPDWHRYTGQQVERTVTYIIREGFGIPPGYYIMGLGSVAYPKEVAPTVEKVEQAVVEWCMHWCERVAPDTSDWDDLRARLNKLMNQ